MAEDRQPAAEPAREYRVNFFRPRRGFMRKEVALIWIMLAGWALLTFGFQMLLVLFQRNDAGQSALTEATVFGFPFHYWFTGQFLIVWFILLCILANVFIDRLTKRSGRHR